MLYASDFRRIAREALKNNWVIAVVTGLVAALLGAGGFSMPNFRWDERRDFTNFNMDLLKFFLPIFIGVFSIAMLYAIIIFIIRGPIMLGYARFNKNLLDHTNPQLSDLFSKFNDFGNAFLMQLLINIYTFLWTLLFFIPGIIAALSYAMTPYILEDNPNLSANEAIRHSKVMMQGNKWRLFCLEISFIGWWFLSVLTCGVGFLLLVPYMNAAVVAFYYDVSGKYAAQKIPPNYQQSQQGYNQQGQYQPYQNYQQNQQQYPPYPNNTLNQPYPVEPINPISKPEDPTEPPAPTHQPFDDL